MSKVVYKVENDISTDVIYPGRFMATVLPSETPEFAFADDPEFNKKLINKGFPEGSIIIAGDNFGCGSSREQAASTLKGHGLIVVAKNFARIFMQNSINLGLRLVICPEIEGALGDEIEIEGETLINKTSGKNFKVMPLPETKQAIIDAGGLIPYTRKRVLEKKVK